MLLDNPQTFLTLYKKLALEGITPSKALGQNFIYDHKIVDKIVKNEIIKDKIILEIGPGPGMLTKAIAEKLPAKLILVEKDPRLSSFLRSNLLENYPIIEIIEADALSIRIKDLGYEKVTIISNLPYNISVKLLSNWFNEIELVDKMVLMFQKEVGNRLMASKSTKAYGSLSIITQWLFNLENKFNLPPGAFYPRPKIESSVISFEPRLQPKYPANKLKLEKLCKSIFQMRRKMIVNSLKPLLRDLDQVLANLNISPNLRPEDLSIEQLCQISEYIEL